MTLTGVLHTYLHRGFAGLMAREFGNRPEAATDRMRLDPAACQRDACQLR